MNRHPLSLSRTSSSTSFSSEDDGASMSSSTVTISTSRRTRKRFTNTQLIMLENLFHQNSHPSRDDREAVAKAGGMYVFHSRVVFDVHLTTGAHCPILQGNKIRDHLVPKQAPNGEKVSCQHQHEHWPHQL